MSRPLFDAMRNSLWRRRQVMRHRRLCGERLEARLVLAGEPNAAPLFTKGPDIHITDELSHVAPATVISFDALHANPDDPFYFYEKDGFTVRPVDGRWLEAHEFTHVTGYPGPGIWGDIFTGAVEVTRTGGGLFGFHSADMTTWSFGDEVLFSGEYTIRGLLGGQTVYSVTAELPVHELSGFLTADSPSPELVDTVVLSFVRGSQAYVVDNIRVVLPGSTASPWATGISAGSPDESGQLLHFHVVSNSNSDLFAVPPSIDRAGNLIFAPKPNASGAATIVVELQDNGGTSDGGIDTSGQQSFVITVEKERPWHNVVNGLDVTLDGHVVAADALEVINFINAFGSGPEPVTPPEGQTYLDVNGDRFIAAGDALEIINYLNAFSSGPTASTAFVETDTTTQGNWQGVYGADGYYLALGPTSLPAYATASSYGNTHLWTDTTSDPRALQLPNETDRLAATWIYRYHGFIVDVDLQDDVAHRVSLYFLDWDGNNGRSQRVEILDAGTGAVLDSQPLQSFSDGKYLTWLVRGHVHIHVTPMITDDVRTAILSGVFFG